MIALYFYYEVHSLSYRRHHVCVAHYLCNKLYEYFHNTHIDLTNSQYIIGNK